MSTGRYTGQTDYSAFGEVIGGNNPGASQSVYQWGAQSNYRMDGASGGGGGCGLVKVGARYYDPGVGRFTSRGSDLDESAYVYCDADPINFTDPGGHQKKKDKPKLGDPDYVPDASPAPPPANSDNIRKYCHALFSPFLQRILLFTYFQ